MTWRSQRTLARSSCLVGWWGVTALGAVAAEPTVTSFAEYHLLGARPDFAPQAVGIEATVLYYDFDWRVLFLQDATAGFYLGVPAEGFGVQPGQRVTLEGQLTRGPTGPALAQPSLAILGAPGMPAPVETSVAALNDFTLPNRWVTVSGNIRWVRALGDVLEGQLTDGTNELAFVWKDFTKADLRRWFGAGVTMRGAAALDYQDGRRVGCKLFVPRLEDVMPTTTSSINPFDRPVNPVGSLKAAAGTSTPGLVRVLGLAAASEGRQLQLRDETGTVLVRAIHPLDFEPGARLEAVGRPALVGTQIELLEGVVLAAGPTVDPGTSPTVDRAPNSSLPTMSRIDEIRALSQAEAAGRYPVSVTGVVTYQFADWSEMFVQDEHAGIFVGLGGLRPDTTVGDRVLVRGFTDPGGYAPIILATSLEKLGPGQLPVANLRSLTELKTGNFDSQWVEMTGVVQGATNTINGMGEARARTQAGAFHLRLPRGYDGRKLIDSVIRVKGVVASSYNEKRELTNIELRVPEPEFLEIERPAPVDPFSMETGRLGDLRQFRAAGDAPRLVKVRGVVTGQRADGSFYLQDAQRGAIVLARQPRLWTIGDEVEAVGYFEAHHSSGLLMEAVVRPVGRQQPPAPLQITRHNLLDDQNDQRWTAVQGRFVGQVRRGTHHVALLQVGDWIVEASSPPGAPAARDPPRLGALVEYQGVFAFHRDLLGNVQGLNLEAHSQSAPVILEQPSPWTATRIRTAAVAILALSVISLWRIRVATQTNRQLRREIEERLVAERSLTRNQFLLRTLMENSPDYIYFKDLESRFVQVNRATALKAGFTGPEAMVGCSDFDLFDEVTARQFREDELSVIETGKAIIAKEDREVTRDGSVCWTESTTIPHYDETGRICGVIGISRDITTRKRAEGEVARQKQHYQVMFDAMPALVMYKDTGNRVLRINRFGAALLGRSAAEVEGRSLFELDPEHADRFYEDDLEIVRTATPKLGIEEIVGTADGRTVRLRTDKLPDRDAQHRIIGVIVFAVDVTAQKTAETALLQAQEQLEKKVRERTTALQREIAERNAAEVRLREQERFVRAVIDTDPNMIFTKDRDGRFTLVNRAVCEFLRRPEPDIIGRTAAELGFDQETIDSIQREDLAVWRQQCERQPVEEQYRNCHGEVRCWQTVKRPLFDQTNLMTHLLGVSVDITERKRREEETRRTEAFLNSVVQHLPITVFIKEAATLKFVLWNRAGEELTGYRNEEMVGRNDYDFFPRAEADRFIANDREALQAGRVIEIDEEVLVTRHRGRRIMHTKKIPICDAQGRPQYLLGIAEDVTERKQADEELRRARDAAEAANRAKSEFLANMSHEIRTPMNGVIGMTNLLLSTHLSAEQLDYAENARRCAESLLSIINDILDFSKIEAGRLHFEELDFDLRELVESALDLVADLAREKAIELGVILPETVERALAGDPGRLRQILLNLLGNAVKFTAAGEVVVEVTQVAASEQRVRLRFEVTDTGVGIPAEVQSRLFQPFTQADGSTTRKFGGTGLGLVISRQLTELMAGDIGVRSTPGQGSTFWFTVELKKQPPGQTPAPPPSESLARARILAVDDNALNRRILSEHLATKVGAFAAAESGSEALELLQAAVHAGTPFNAAILDMQMPGMDGLALAEAIQRDSALSGTRLVLLSSLGQMAPGAELRRRGIAMNLIKPVKQGELYQCLAAILAGQTGTAFRRRRLPAHAPSSRSPAPARLRVLVAEDNAVNQKVAARTLNKLGYDADCVANGREVLSAVESILYDVILMDCNMPEMDGYEATRVIRERAGRRQPYIIAMTANAMVGDRDKCLAAGMNSYLTKPLREADLDEALANIPDSVKTPMPARPDPVAAADQKVSPSPPPAPARVDAEAIARLRELGEPGGPDLAAEFIDLYLADGGALLGKLGESCAAGDGKLLKRQAHTLKGSSRNMGADTVAEVAGEIEAKAETGTREELTPLVRRLEQVFRDTAPLLQAHKQTAAPP